jgi:hypothetical protein
MLETSKKNQIFLVNESKESDEIFGNVSFVEMESSKLILVTKFWGADIWVILIFRKLLESIVWSSLNNSRDNSKDNS